MSGEKSIVLRGDDREDLEELKEKWHLSRNIDVFRKLVSFYKANSPLYEIVGSKE